MQRESIADDQEMVRFVSNFLRALENAGKPQTWSGVVSATCGDVRDIRLHDKPDRVICIYATGEPGNPAHAEMCQTTLEDWDKNEIRDKLRKLFKLSAPTAPADYRGGRVSDELQK